ncbi:hypothetical protein Tco_0140757 [Tanacetum coccineum]
MEVDTSYPMEVDTPYPIEVDTPYPIEVDTPYRVIEQNNGLIYHRYGVSNVFDMAYWGFLGVGTTFDIFQNLHILYLGYGVLPSFKYGVLILFPSWYLVKSRHRYAVSSLMDTAYWYVRITAYASPTTLSPGYIADSNLKDESKDGPIDYPADGGDDDDDSSRDHANEEEEESSKEEEEHLAPTDSTAISLAVGHVSSAEET